LRDRLLNFKKMKLLLQPSFILKRFFPSLIWKISSHEKVIFLTFDDGPIPSITPWVLEQLKSFDAKATFFCIGKNAAENPVLLKQIKEEGHAIGHHTFNHVNGWKTKNQLYFDNVEKGNETIPSKLYRPPYGKITPTQIRQLKSKYEIVMWDVLSFDFDSKTSPEKCLEITLQHAKKGSIVVFHDSIKAKKSLYYALPRFLKHFTDCGFRFESLACLQS